LEQFRELGADAGEVDIVTIFTSLNVGTERARFYGMPNAMTDFPYTPSCTGLGRVVRVGKRVSGFSAGDIVAGPFKSANIQSVAAKKLAKIPADIPNEDAAMVRLCNIAIQGVRMGKLQAGQRVVVMGQGVIGRLATLLARAEGIHDLSSWARA
jgi:NADPH:quinone reductase-like Zn-dependent oxidoreductase